MGKHTPTPWQVCYQSYPGGKGQRWVRRAHETDEHAVCLVYRRQSREEADSNAEFIVRAVNAHDALLAACEAARATLVSAVKAGLSGFSPEDADGIAENHVTVQQIDDAIALSESEAANA